jgi:class 3 adenylate cyclase
MKHSGKLENKRDMTDYFENVTLLYADIKGFTEYSNKKEP